MAAPHRRRAHRWVALCAVLALAATACSDDGTSGSPQAGASSSSGPGSGTTGGGRTTALPQGNEAYPLDPADLSPVVTHRFWPMRRATRWTYREVDESGATLEVVVTVSDVTRTVGPGYEALVVRDTVSEDGTVVEDTFDWYAQDRAGNVWYLGEDTAEFEDGVLVSREGSFEAGVDGALAGVLLPAEPEPGQRYRQEYYAGEAEDNGEVLALGQLVEVPAGRYDEALLTRDTDALEPEVNEYKLYAPGVGPVLALGISGGSGREELLSVQTVPLEVAHRAGTAPLGTSYD